MILLFGPAGAGKSVQGKLLAARESWRWISTGELLRQSDDPAVIATLKTGELVRDDLTYEVFERALAESHANGYANVIVDGFPRTAEQATWLEHYMQKAGDKIDLVIVLEVPEAEVLSRLARRGRMEDSPEIIAKRMAIYRQKMYPVLNIFAQAGVKIAHIDGVGTTGEVHDRVYSIVSQECQN